MSVRKKLMSVVAAVATAAAMGATGVAANAADVVAVPQEGLSDTGASIAIVVVLVVVLAAIGVGVTVAPEASERYGRTRARARTRAPPRADWWPMVLIRLIRRPCSPMTPLRPRMTPPPVRRNPATPSDSGITAMCKRPSSEGLLR